MDVAGHREQTKIARERIREISNPYFISREMSELVVRASLHDLYGRELPLKNTLSGTKIGAEMESRHREMLGEYYSNK